MALRMYAGGSQSSATAGRRGRVELPLDRKRRDGNGRDKRDLPVAIVGIAVDRIYDLRFAIYDCIWEFGHLAVATYPPNEVSRASGRKRGAPRRRGNGRGEV